MTRAKLPRALTLKPRTIRKSTRPETESLCSEKSCRKLLAVKEPLALPHGYRTE